MEPDQLDRFQSHNLSEKERISGSIISGDAKRCIQNLISGYAHDVFLISYTESKPHEAAIRKSYLDGAIEALEYVISTSQALEAELAASPTNLTT